MSQDIVYEAIAYAIQEKIRRLEYYKEQVAVLSDDVKRMQAELKRLENKEGKVPLNKD